MSIRGSVVGWVTKTEMIEPKEPGKKPFLLIHVESKNKFTNYPSRTKVMLYGKDIIAVKEKELHEGALVRAEGDVSADAYISTKTGKAMASMRLYASMLEVLELKKSWGEAGDHPPQPQRQPQQRPQRQAPPTAEGDDVPY